MRKNTVRPLLLGVLPLLGISLISLSACSKKEEETASSTSPAASTSSASSSAATKSASTIDLSKSLLELVPKDTLGFFLFQGKNPAYASYKSSPWASGGSNWSNMLKSANPETQNITEMMKRLGFNVEDKNTFDKLLTEAAFFVAPPASGEMKPSIGLVFRPDSSFKLDDFVANVKKEVTAGSGNLKVEDAKIGSVSGLRFEDTSDGGAAGNPLKEFFMASKSGLAVVGTSKTMVEGVLASAGGSLPDILAGTNFQKSSAGFSGASSRFATFFFDFEKFASLAEKFGGTALAAKLKESPFPLKAVSMALAMEDAPKTEFRLLYDDVTPQNKEWFSTLATSPSANVLAAVSEKPLFFLSIDGQTIQKAKEKALATMGPQAAAMRTQLAALDGITRIGIAAKSAAPGASMLPIPEFLVVAETKDAAKLSATVEQLVGPAVMGGMPGMQWQSSTDSGVAVRSLQSPMGVGAFLASSKNLFILASTKGQMSGALKSASGQGTGFAKGLSSPVEQVLAKQATIGNLYVNFNEVASALESVGGMLSMFAPQGGEAAQQFLSPENIQSLRQMGSVVGSVTLDPGAINITSFYQKG